MRRRTVVCGTVALLAAPLAAEAQQAGKVPRIGVLAGDTPSSFSARVEAFQQGLKEHGYIEGKTIAIEYRYAEGKLDRLPGLAGDLVRLKVDLIVASGPGAEAAKNATNATPIVMTDVSDPVATGLVVSLAHPGGNVTGLGTVVRGLDGKRLELFKEAFPKISRVAVLWDPSSASNAVSLRDTRDAAQVLRLTLQPLEVRGADDFAAAFMAIQRDRSDALTVLRNPATVIHRRRIVDSAAHSRLPAVYSDSEFTNAGGLMSYGTNRAEVWRRAAYYVDRILKGAKPANLPVEQPTKFELVINLKTARALGLTIPRSLLLRADQVIE